MREVEWRYVIGTKGVYEYGGKLVRMFVSHGGRRMTPFVGGAVLYKDEPNMSAYNADVWGVFRVRLEVDGGV